MDQKFYKTKNTEPSFLYFTVGATLFNQMTYIAIAS